MREAMEPDVIVQKQIFLSTNPNSAFTSFLNRPHDINGYSFRTRKRLKGTIGTWRVNYFLGDILAHLASSSGGADNGILSFRDTSVLLPTRS